MSRRAPLTSELAGLRFLVVDDQEVMRLILRDILARYGCDRVEFAAGGKAALDLLGRQRYDVVLCDLHLGAGKNGLQVLEEARHRQLLPPHAVWLMISAEKSGALIAGTMEARPDDYLIKPITETALYNRLIQQWRRKATLAPVLQAMADLEYLKAQRLVDTLLRQAAPGQLWDLMRLRAELAVHSGDHATARNIFARILQQRDLPWARLGLAKLLYHDNQFEDAQRELELLTQDYRAYLDAYDWLARTLDRQGDLEAAQAVLVRALAISPRVPRRQGLLGEVAYKRGDLVSAERAFHHTVELARHTLHQAMDPYLWLSRVNVGLGRRDNALSALAGLARDMDDHPPALLLARAMEIPVWFHTGAEVQADRIAGEMAERLKAQVHTLPAEAVLDLADPLLQLGDRETAGLLLAGLIGNHHDHPEYLGRVQDLYARAGLEEEGRALVSKAAAEVSGIMNRGVMLARAGRLEEAINLTREALDRMPSNPRLLLNHAYLLIAWMEHNGRDFTLAQEAQECIETARRLKPGERRTGELLTKLEVVGGNL